MGDDRAQTLPKLSKDKASHYRTAWAALEPLKNAKIRNLRYAHLQPIVDAREGGYYPKRDIKALLGKMYTLALKYEYADKDYSKLLDLPPISASTRTALTEDEVQRIWQDYDAGHEFSRYWLIMAYTGMRTGEMLTILKANTHLAEQYCTGGIKTDAGKARRSFSRTRSCRLCGRPTAAAPSACVRRTRKPSMPSGTTWPSV